MNKPKPKYPLLAVRLNRRQMAYIRRRAKECNVKVSHYVKEMLAPRFALNGK